MQLAILLADDGQLSDGLRAVVPMVEQLRGTGHLAMAVRMTDDVLEADLTTKAREAALRNSVYAQQIGDIRSEIIAATLLSRLAWAQSNPGEAQTEAYRAVALLQRSGRLPALQAERVYFYTANMLALTGREDDAVDGYRRAHDEVQRKTSLLDPEHRENFAAIPLNKAIGQMAGSL